jgi:single-stranded DNA-binding protein
MNIVILSGRLASSPEVKTSKGGLQYASTVMTINDSTDKFPMEVEIVVFARNLDALMNTKVGGFIQVSGKLNVYNPREQSGQSSRSGKQFKVVVDSIILPAERVATQDSGNAGYQNNNGNYQPRPGGNGYSGTAPTAVVAPPEIGQSNEDPFGPDY